MKSHWRNHCKATFNALRANVDNWKDPSYFRAITRIYYIGVFDCKQVNHLGLISESARSNADIRTQDHCMSPQFVGRMIMDKHEIYLTDYELFENLFWLSCSVITVTKKENTRLSRLTSNNGTDYKVYVPTNLKYKHLGIQLYKKTESRLWKDSVKYDNNIIPAPTDLLEYEKSFLANYD